MVTTGRHIRPAQLNRRGGSNREPDMLPGYSPKTPRSTVNKPGQTGEQPGRSLSTERGEHLVHTEGVTGSIPVASTRKRPHSTPAALIPVG